MTDELVWYVLDFNEGALVTAGGGAVEVTTFRGPLSTRDGEAQFSLRLWRAPDRPDELPETVRNEARENCLLAVGSAGELAIELRANGARFQVGRGAEVASTRTLRFNLGHEVLVHPNEVFDAPEAAELFLSYYRTGTVSAAEYQLRELAASDAMVASPTHVLTVNYDEHRPVLPTVDAGEFSAFLSDTGESEPSVLVLRPFPKGGTTVELTGGEMSGSQEFMQTAGSSGRYTVEMRRLAGDTHKLYTISHVVDYLVWGTEPTEIAIGPDVLQVYPNEVFTPAEVGNLFHHYTRTGQLPEDGYMLREIPLAD
jgi:hypothetical protein